MSRTPVIAELGANTSPIVQISRDASPGAGGGLSGMRFGYADPPYPGKSGVYRDHPDYAGDELEDLYSGSGAVTEAWRRRAIHAPTSSLWAILALARSWRGRGGARAGGCTAATTPAGICAS